MFMEKIKLNSGVFFYLDKSFFYVYGHYCLLYYFDFGSGAKILLCTMDMKLRLET